MCLSRHKLEHNHNMEIRCLVIHSPLGYSPAHRQVSLGCHAVVFPSVQSWVPLYILSYSSVFAWCFFVQYFASLLCRMKVFVTKEGAEESRASVETQDSISSAGVNDALTTYCSFRYAPGYQQRGFLHYPYVQGGNP